MLQLQEHFWPIHTIRVTKGTLVYVLETHEQAPAFS